MYIKLISAVRYKYKLKYFKKNLPKQNNFFDRNNNKTKIIS